MTDAQNVLETVRAFAMRVKGRPDVGLDTLLYGDGIGLDSLEIGELGAILEDEYGSDPFQAGLVPDTVGDVVAFYDKSA